MNKSDPIYLIPLKEQRCLLYAPLHRLSAVINRAAAAALQQSLARNAAPDPALTQLRELLHDPPLSVPPTHTGALEQPYFLGLLPTRACGMGCRYCDFATARNQHFMSRETAQKAIDSYLNLLKAGGHSEGQIHFFGGEPFSAFELVSFAVDYARQQASQQGIRLHFEATSNGYYSHAIAAWAADHLDTIVLSFDGFPDCQNAQRPGKAEAPSYEAVSRNAEIFSQGNCELVIRSCVTARNVSELSAWARFISRRYILSSVCFEPMIDSPLSAVNQIASCMPLDFVKNFYAASQELRSRHIPLFFASAEHHSLRSSLCPLGQDALIISPEGQINACWQLEESWGSQGLDFRLGELGADGFQIRQKHLDAVRALSAANRRGCEGCFCFYHCAGGCMLNHNRPDGSGKVQDYCRMTRLITLLELLQDAGQVALAGEILEAGNPFHWIQDNEYRLPAHAEAPLRKDRI